MKKCLLFSLILGYACTVAHAHTLTPKGPSKAAFAVEDIKFGANLGLALCLPAPKPGLHASLFGNLKLTNRLDVATTIAYQRIIVVDSYAPPRSSELQERKEKVEYLQTNISLSCFPGQDRQFFFSIGPYIGYILGLVQEINVYESGKITAKETSDVKKF